MDQESIKNVIREHIIEMAEDMELDKKNITDDAHFIKDMGFDSMALLEILATMEKKFVVSIPESEFPNIVTINKCAETIGKYLAAK